MIALQGIEMDVGTWSDRSLGELKVTLKCEELMVPQVCE